MKTAVHSGALQKAFDCAQWYLICQIPLCHDKMSLIDCPQKQIWFGFCILRSWIECRRINCVLTWKERPTVLRYFLVRFRRQPQSAQRSDLQWTGNPDPFPQRWLDDFGLAGSFVKRTSALRNRGQGHKELFQVPEQNSEVFFLEFDSTAFLSFYKTFPATTVVDRSSLCDSIPLSHDPGCRALSLEHQQFRRPKVAITPLSQSLI
jgi:hypothetical protein